MKLTVGQHWTNPDTDETLGVEIKGLAAIERGRQLDDGELILPKDGDSQIEVRAYDGPSFWRGTITLRRLVENYVRQDAPVGFVKN